MIRATDKIKAGIDRLKKDDLNYFEEQFMYGHREILISYILENRVDFPSRSYLQAGLAHGWAPHFEIWRLRKKSLIRAPRYIWNSPFTHEQNLKFGQIPIGSPWLYMLLTLGIEPGQIAELPVKDGRINLVMPYHSEGVQLKKISDQASHYKSFLNPTETTVCLFWNDFCDPINRAAYLNLGFKLECVGYPHRVKDSYKIGSPRTFFLINLLKLLLEHRTYITDSVSTSLFYASSLGKDVIIKGDKISNDFLLNFTLPSNKLNATDAISSDEWLVKNEHFHTTASSKLQFLNLKSWIELGLENILTPEELTKLHWKESTAIPEHLVEFRIQLLNTSKQLEKTSMS
jgi:hypothetical protein